MKQFRRAVVHKLCVPISADQAELLFREIDSENVGVVSFHHMMTQLMQPAFELDRSHSNTLLVGVAGKQISKARSIRVPTRKWPSDQLFRRLRESLILRGGGLPVAMKYYSCQQGRNNDSGMFVTKEGMRYIVQSRFHIPASDEECDTLFRKFNPEGKEKISFIEIYNQLDIGGFRQE